MIKAMMKNPSGVAKFTGLFNTQAEADAWKNQSSWATEYPSLVYSQEVVEDSVLPAIEKRVLAREKLKTLRGKAKTPKELDDAIEALCDIVGV